MIKTAHEAPKSIFSEMQKITDIDYALVHLFEEDEEYFNKFKKAVEDSLIPRWQTLDCQRIKDY